MIAVILSFQKMFHLKDISLFINPFVPNAPFQSKQWKQTINI